MYTWELWVGDSGQLFFPEHNEQARRMAVADGMKLTWTTVAKGHNSAMQNWYDHRGSGNYQPMLRDDGTPYPEDEDEDLRT